MGTRSRKSKMPISDDYLTGPALENLLGYLEDPFPSLPRATADQQKSQSTKPKKSTQQETTTPAAHQPLSLDKQTQLEQLKHSNLQLQLELTRTQLELAKLSPNVKPSQAISSMKPEVLSPLDNILASTPFRPPTQEVFQRVAVSQLSKICGPKTRKSENIFPYCLMITFSPQKVR